VRHRLRPREHSEWRRGRPWWHHGRTPCAPTFRSNRIEPCPCRFYGTPALSGILLHNNFAARRFAKERSTRSPDARDLLPTSVAVIGVSAKPDNLGRKHRRQPGGVRLHRRRVRRGPERRDDRNPPHLSHGGRHPRPGGSGRDPDARQTVPAVIATCGEKGIRWAVIETAGFREFTDAGRAVEEEISRVAAQYGIRFVGPTASASSIWKMGCASRSRA